MAETWNKKEREKKKSQNKKEKAEKKQERKENHKSKSLDEMLAYVDENGNLSATPPDPKKMKVFKQEEITIGIPKHEEEDQDAVREGIISFFNDAKGYGFIRDIKTQESIFVHSNQLSEPVQEKNK